MRLPIFCSFLVCGLVSAQSTNVSHFVPVEKLSANEKRMVDRELKAARSDFAASHINLTRDVQDKRLTVYAVVSSVHTAVITEAGFKIRVTYHRAFKENYEPNLGCYARHYNIGLLDFALAQYSEGNKSLALLLGRLLATADPDLVFVSSESEAVNIGTIVAKLEDGDRSLSPVLKAATRNWRQWGVDYRP